MDTTDSDISFDEHGHCNHCSDFLQYTIHKTYQGANNDLFLKKEIEKIKNIGRNSAYDCIVGISGGVDSCYTAVICKQLGLRVLLVHVDNGWDSETSVKNIEVVCKALQFDYESCILNWQAFKEIQLSHLKASIPEIETPTDIALLDELHKVAAKHKVKYIISGGNYVTEGILPKFWHYNAKDKKYSYGIYKRFTRIKVNYFPSFDILKEFYFKFFRGIKIFYLLNHVPFNKQTATEELEKIGWKKYGGKHHESFYTRVVQSYILPKKFNIDYRKATLSTKICMGQISRDEALHELLELPYNELNLDNDINYFCKKFEIEKEDFTKIMNDRPKSYLEYSNNQFLLEFIYKVYQKISGKK